jgi:hypothetical protein
VTRRTYSGMWAAILGIACSVATAAAQQVKAPAPSPAGEARERNLRAYTQLLRSDLRTQKVAVITEMMRFTEAEDTAFWPIYREYEVELSRLNDQRLAAIEIYAKTYTQLTAATATELAMKSLDLEARRAALKQRYFMKLMAAMSPVTAARVLQVENQIQLIVDLQVAAALPVVP